MNSSRICLEGSRSNFVLYNESPETVRDWHDAECRINISGRCADLGQIFKQRNEHTEIFLLLCNLVGYALGLPAQQTAVNPLIYADVPDMSMVRVDDTYYMSSTTMHMVPGYLL